MAGGLCDNLAVRTSLLLFCFSWCSSYSKTSVLRALSPDTPTLVFPAMNTLMYENPLTTRHLDTVKEILKYEVHGPIGKRLACGDIGEALLLC